MGQKCGAYLVYIANRYHVNLNKNGIHQEKGEHKHRRWYENKIIHEISTILHGSFICLNKLMKWLL